MSNSSKKTDVTIYDIAEVLDVSPSTVSRSLQNHSSISSNTRKKVKEQAKRMGYRSNIFAKNLRRKKTHILGIIVPKLNSHFISSAIAGIEEVANKDGYNLIISQSLETMQKEINNAEAMFESRVDGLIVSLAYNSDDLSHFDPFIENDTPLIFFDRVAYYKSSTTIVIDNFHASFQAVNHLLEQGCQRIAHITGNLSRNVYQDRLRGHKEALKNYDIPFNDAFLFENDLTTEDGQKAAHAIMKMDPRPDGIFITNDACAIACMSTLKQLGIHIPTDMAIVGFNNDPISRYVEPKLTTVNYSGLGMGKAIARNIIDRLQNKDDKVIPRSIVLNADLIVRDSSLKKSAKAQDR